VCILLLPRRSQPYTYNNCASYHALVVPQWYHRAAACLVDLSLPLVQSQVLGMYVLHSSMGSCGAPQLLVQLDDAISDAMGEAH
jgi:hypothetical protein